MKKKHFYLLAFMALLFTALSFETVRSTLFFDSKIAYAEPSYTILTGSDGSEHIALDNFYPKTIVYSGPSDWDGKFGLTWAQVVGQLGLSKKARNTCRILDTHCEEYEESLCPFILTGVAVVTSDNQVIPVWHNPF